MGNMQVRGQMIVDTRQPPRYMEEANLTTPPRNPAMTSLANPLPPAPLPEPSVSPFTSVAPRLIVVGDVPLELTGGALDALQLAEIFVQVYNADQRPAIRKVARLCEERGWTWACHAIVHALEAWTVAEDRYAMAQDLRQLRAEPAIQWINVPCRTCASTPGEVCSILKDGGNRPVPHPGRVADADALDTAARR